MNRIIKVAIGPRLPEFGSWNWWGDGLTQNLNLPFVTEQFTDPANPPAADIVIFIKFLPPHHQLELIARNSKIVYLPIDVHGDCREIDDCYQSLRLFSKVLTNSRSLLLYFRGYCDVDYIDHPLKYVLANPRLTDDDGPLVWIGQLCNLQPVVDWVNSQQLGRELWLLSNFASSNASSKSLGFAKSDIRLENWTEERHLDYLRVTTAAIDVKGNDFRARHKPPAKAFDFLATGIPVITNCGSSVDNHMCQLGLPPLLTETWRSELTRKYRQTVFEFADHLREIASPQIVWQQMRSILSNVLNESVAV